MTKPWYGPHKVVSEQVNNSLKIVREELDSLERSEHVINSLKDVRGELDSLGQIGLDL